MLSNWWIVLALIFLVKGVESQKNFKDSIIECTFKQYADCYRDIASLGANFSAKFDETNDQINDTCRFQNRVQQCISRIVPDCGLDHFEHIVEEVNSMIQKLCTNKTVQQTNFLNSSVCYNKNQNTRIECVKKNVLAKNDAKSICCSALKTHQCIREEMRPLCPKNSTQFQTHIMETFTNFELAVCGSYLRHCNSATNLMSSTILYLGILIFLMFSNTREIKL